MKLTSILIITLIAGSVSGQSIHFEQVPAPSPFLNNIADFHSTYERSIDHADIDSDGDQDIFINGESVSFHINDGTGNFAQQLDTVIFKTVKGTAEFADVDDDGDPDLFVTGTTSNGPVAILYINNCAGEFVEQSGAPFIGVYWGATDFSDVDGDNDLDLLVTGEDSTGTYRADLYLNDGAGNFSLMAGTPFQGVTRSSVRFGDIDSDNDFDVIINGFNIPSQENTKMYINDGTGTFTLVVSTPFENLNEGNITFGDVGMDNGLDVMLVGEDENNKKKTRLYVNDGSGNYSLSSETFLGYSVGCINIDDVDGDNDPDILISGPNTSDLRARLYLNDGLGAFSLVWPSNFYSDGNASFLTDLDGDNDLDAYVSSSARPHHLYINDGAGAFTMVKSTPFRKVMSSDVDYADVNNDGFLDIMITGLTDFGQLSTTLYINTGAGNFVESPGSSVFTDVSNGAIDFVDLDNDNDQDVIISGGTLGVSQTYMNDGAGNFSLFNNNALQGVYLGDNDVADIDNDGDMDLLITGFKPGGYYAELYKNNGTGFFSQVTDPFDDVWYSHVEFGDVDGDNDLDVVICGQLSGVGNFTTKLFTNDGTGVYSEVIGTPFTPIRGNCDFIDYDNDNDLDVIIGGWDGSGPITELYENDGSGGYSLVLGTPFEPISSGDIEIGDINGDNYDDIILTGVWVGNLGERTIIYLNDGAGNFTPASDLTFEIVPGDENTRLLDFDNDGLMDIMMTGLSNKYRETARLYRQTSGCVSTSSNIYASVCDQYSSPAGNVYAMSGTYNEVISNAGGCDSLIAICLEINTIDVTVSQSGNTLTTNASGMTYTWVDCDNNYSSIPGATNQSFTPVVAGNYAVIVDNGSCSDTSVCTSMIVGLSDIIFANSITIAPNPTSDKVVISGINSISNLSADVLNVDGQIVKRIENVNNNEVVSLPSSGMYFIAFYENGRIIATKKVVRN